jgi:hypothetical protein
MPSPAITALKRATKGLLYTSESDAPFETVHWEGVGELSGEKVRELGGHKKKDPVQQESLDDFFADLVQEQDWQGAEERADVKKYRRLLTTLRKQLTDLRVYRVGRVNVTLYVVGKTPEGDWAGVKTTAVET